VSPLLQADLSGLAPAYLAVAEYDPLFDEGLAYAEALREQGNALTLQVAEGLTYDFADVGHGGRGWGDLCRAAGLGVGQGGLRIAQLFRSWGCLPIAQGRSYRGIATSLT
jgi:acetyl esterase/lipase